MCFLGISLLRRSSPPQSVSSFRLPNGHKSNCSLHDDSGPTQHASAPGPPLLRLASPFLLCPINSCLLSCWTALTGTCRCTQRPGCAARSPACCCTTELSWRCKGLRHEPQGTIRYGSFALEVALASTVRAFFRFCARSCASRQSPVFVSRWRRSLACGTEVAGSTSGGTRRTVGMAQRSSHGTLFGLVDVQQGSGVMVIHWGARMAEAS